MRPKTSVQRVVNADEITLCPVQQIGYKYCA
jgi:hypothetical protein